MTENTSKAPLIVGTAGHIDHGKTSLVRALTGTDTDRLIEEKKRGITIELGYAFLGESLAFIDVPGHEKFIRQMVAGAATVDAGMLVVAADDGVMPQTREHLDILSLLGIQRGLVVISKADLAEPDWLALVREDVARLIAASPLAGAPILVADSLSGRGLDEIRAALDALLAEHPGRPSDAPAYLPIDRVFSMKGHGTVVTGSLLAGRFENGQAVQVYPPGRSTRIKGIQSGGAAVESVSAGRRVALNLHQLSVDELTRGDVVALPGSLGSTRRFDIRLEVLASAAKPVAHRQRLRLHVGTAEVMARISLLDCDACKPGESALAQLHLETPCVARRGDRIVLRRYSPPLTLAGGVVLDPQPPSHRRNRPVVTERLEQLAGEDHDAVLAALALLPFATAAELACRISLAHERTSGLLERLESDGVAVQLAAGRGARWVATAQLTRMEELAAQLLDGFHAEQPLAPGLPTGQLFAQLLPKRSDSLYAALLERFVADNALKRVDGEHVARTGFESALSSQRESLEAIMTQVDAAGFAPPTSDELAAAVRISPKRLAPLLDALVAEKRLLRLEGQWWLAASRLDEAVVFLKTHFAANPTLSLSTLREALSTSRKYALPIAAWLDDHGYTERTGSERVAGRTLRAMTDQEDV